MLSKVKVAEWGQFWPLPFVALLGMAGSGVVVYSSGVFMGELTREFGWTKTQYTSGMTVQLLITLIIIPIVGRAVDRFGPRAVALFGIVPTILGTAMLGFVNGQLWQWWMLLGIQTTGAVIIVPSVWITAVVGRFDASRGLALAVALAGIGVGTAVWPMLAAAYINMFGWRLAYGALALTWGAVILPLAILFFYGPEDRKSRAEKAARPRAKVAHHLRSRTFLALAGAGGMFVLICGALILHLVPILRDEGFSLGVAAGFAGVTGLCSIIGRLVTGVLLDLMPARKLGYIVFLLPGLVGVMLANADGGYGIALAAAAFLGLAMGAESDILNYIASRRFEHAIFGSIASLLQTVTAVASVAGVVSAGLLYDVNKSYELFLWLTIPLAIIGVIFLALVPVSPETV